MLSDIKIDKEFSSLIPPLSEEERHLLEQSIIDHGGARDPLVVWSGEPATLIDGHNRFEICDRLGLPYNVHEMQFDSREDVCDWIDANQLGRRNLTPDSFRLLLGRRYNRMKKAQGARGKQKTGHFDPSSGHATADSLAAEHGVTEKTVRRAGKFAEEVEQTPELQQAIIDRVPVKAVQRERKRTKVQATAKLPTDKYRVLYADPPWSYNDKLTADYGPVRFHYQTMTIRELCAMPVKGICEPDAVLFLWVTSPLLYQAEPIIAAWGFKYKTSFVWDKVKHNMGHYNSVRHEFLLVCTRGSCVPDNRKLYDSVQSIDRTKHSEKPEGFRSIIDTLYPHGKRIELFARKQVDGWEAFGDELPE